MTQAIRQMRSLKFPEGMRIPFLAGATYRAISSLEMSYMARFELSESGLGYVRNGIEIIVSLTSFPSRIEAATVSIKSLLRQTLRPHRIILWLARSQFEGERLPNQLTALQKFGLEIEFCDDLKSHKKYYFAMRDNPDSYIVTYDDDLIYPEDSLEQLYNTYERHKGCIVCNRGEEVVLDEYANIAPYREWRVLSSVGTKEPSMRIMPSTGGGTLYPPSALDEAVFDLRAIAECAPTADDLWMKTMSLLRGTPVIKTTKYHRTFAVVEGSQDTFLAQVNMLGGENDAAVARLMTRYPRAKVNLLGS